MPEQEKAAVAVARPPAQESASQAPEAPTPAPPPFRRLRTYAFDPSLDTQLETAVINQLTVEVPWEDLKPGPAGEYLEVVDHDPAGDYFYQPVDLGHPHLLARDGL